MAMRHSWDEVKELAFGPYMPHMQLAISWSSKNLIAHGKMWTWRSPYVEAASFKDSVRRLFVARLY
jgi:hypothetical protein